MRIFYASDTTPNATFQSNLWRNNLYLPLVDLGHDVIEFKFDLRETFQKLDTANELLKPFILKNRPKVTGALLNQIKAAYKAKPIDLFFSYFYDACVLPEAIEEIKSMGIKTVNWYCNGSYQLHLVSEISPHYNWCLVPEKFRLKDYITLGARPLYCQMAANPNIYKPYDLPVDFDVTFVGQAYGDRPVLIKFLLEQGIDVRAWGWGWQNYGTDSRLKNKPLHTEKIMRACRLLLTKKDWRLAGRQASRLLKGGSSNDSSEKAASMVMLPSHILGGNLSDLEMIQMYSRSKINLGFSSCGDTHTTKERILQVRLREFEATMSGGFYMVEYMDELEDFFKIGQEIVCYQDKEDLAEKIKYYLKHDAERERIRQAGYERAHKDHTWHKRFQKSFKEMNLS